jgi:hypothetical protein
MKKYPDKKDNKTPEISQTPGYPVYPASEDIYSKEKEEPYDETEDSPLDIGLDVPGAELDDANELIGEEDEENNYYSLGGDDHHNLDEPQG